MWAAVAALLATYAAMAFTASLGKGVAFDEGLQLAVGYNIWLNHDLRIEGANGDLVKRWATLPYLISRPKFVGADDPLWKQSRGYELAQKFLFEIGNQPESLLRQARAMVTLLGVATGLLVFLCSRELFGPVGGLISLAIFTFSPSMLAFGGIVSTDMSITLTLFASTWCVWKLLHEITWRRFAASLTWVGLMVLAKPAALVIFPVAAVLVGVKLIRGQPVTIHWWGPTRAIAGRWRQAGVFAALAVGHLFSGWAAIWAHYEFRYAASPNPTDPFLQFYQPTGRDAMPVPLATALNWIEHTHFLPEGFCVGIDNLLGCDDALGSFMHGEWALRGRWTFFPYAIWVKTPPALFVLLLIGIVAWWSCRGGRWSQLYAAAPHLALVGSYLALALTEDINIGHRHVLPIYPSLYVLAGASALIWTRGNWPKLLSVGAIVALAVNSAGVRPHYLAYFGPQVGGPANGYKHLVDSSLDWGMDLPALRRWTDEHNPGGKEQMFLAYFGTDRPEHYGIRARRLPGFLERTKFAYGTLAPGYYAISATLFQGVYTAAFGPWSTSYERLYQTTVAKVVAFQNTPLGSSQSLRERESFMQRVKTYALLDDLRLARLCAWLRHQGEPPNRVGHSIFIWKLDHHSLEAALLGPPVELVNAPPVVRQFRTFPRQ
jgi:hypothetical protein